ncbi:MAG: 1,4-dihydroxy-2-naphthoate polyprenyltransferase [Verrucomicrobiaceae bacterium]|nr:1,4-dihydroxy-2-naphthoate polyprenyltransferase [Verrucomicrobiaceae bacterium]
MATAADWIHAARPKTLGAAVAPVIVGTALGWKLQHQWHPLLAVCTLLSCAALQVATNWFNDALDAVKGADTAARLGPRRITASGIVSVRSVMLAAVAMLGVATVLSVPLIHARGWPIIAIGIPSLYFCFGYTGGPWPLAYRGLGELFVLLFFGLIAVTGSTFVQTGAWHTEALIAGFQVGCLSTVLIAINNLRDRAEDATTGKRTLAVRFGDQFARIEIVLLTILAYALAPSIWTLPALLLGIVVFVKVMRGAHGEALNKLLAASGGQLVLFSILYALGCIFS